MLVAAHRQSGFKHAAVRGRGWSVIQGGLGQAGSGGAAGRVSLTSSSSGPAGRSGATSGGAAQRLATRTTTQTQQQGQSQTTAPPQTPITCPTGTALDYYGEACIPNVTPGTVVTAPATASSAVQLGNGFYYYPGSSMVYNGTQSWDCSVNNCAACDASVAAACSAMGYSTSGAYAASTPTTDYLPWILGGAGVFLLLMMMTQR